MVGVVPHDITCAACKKIGDAPSPKWVPAAGVGDRFQSSTTTCGNYFFQHLAAWCNSHHYQNSRIYCMDNAQGRLSQVKAIMAASTPIRMAILDDYLSISLPHFSKLQSSGVNITVFKDTIIPKDAEQKKSLISRLQPFTVISTMRERTPLPPDVLNSLPNLKLLLTTGIRNASISVPTCTERHITVAGTTGAGRTENPVKTAPRGYDATTQHTWALILGIAKNIARDDLVVKQGGWQTSLCTGLAGKTLGLLGLGRLGSATGRIGALAFGMNVVAWSTSLTQEKADETGQSLGLPAGIFKVVSSKEELFKVSDVVSIHYVLSDRSRGIVGKNELDLLKPSALLVNTSRGPLIDEAALLHTLKAGKIRGAALDVFEVEPLPLNSEWRTTKWGQDGRSEVLLSPHNGYVEEFTMHAWYDETAENVERWLAGHELRNKMN
jgi:phosphoglycerate dehydrogenase-like enzyme